jgi:signal recognition particle subunit SRP54
MFERLTERFESIFKTLRGQGRISERNVEETLREIRRSLLEADVNFQVAKSFVRRVKERAVGHEVLQSLTPGQQFIKIVHDELIGLLGGDNQPLKMADRPPTVIMLVGLQGCGKTTAAGKLAKRFKEQGRMVQLVAADVYRPAAIDQLQSLGQQLEVPVYSDGSSDPLRICAAGLREAVEANRSVLIVDTAGRLGIDEEMMDELVGIRDAITPHEILFVADSMLGQDAVETATRFYERLAFTGCILTKLDGDARGGAALSILEVTGQPIKFIGTGEKLDALETFHPDRMASRILGMGDIVSFVEKAEQAFDQEKVQEMEERLRREAFTFEDFLEQIGAIKQMGPLDQLVGMLPGAAKSLKGVQLGDDAFSQAEAIINSMTSQERGMPQILNGSRRKRIARGSGTAIQDVNRLIKQFQMMQKMFKQMHHAKPGRNKFGFPFMN